MNEKRGTCWVGYQQIGMKKKGDRMVPNCVKEVVDIYWENQNESCGYTFEFEKQPMQEAEYQGRKVKLNKIMQGDAKKFKVYVKNQKGNVSYILKKKKLHHYRFDGKSERVLNFDWWSKDG